MTISTTELNSTSESHLPRLDAFDLARGLAILFMVLIHVLDFYSQAKVQDTLFGDTIEFLGSWPAAPVFVFIMGVFLTYSNNHNLAKGLRRAVLLFALGYLLNLLRGTIPMWFSLEMNLVTYEQLGGYTPLTEFLVVDIFQFAGLAYAICLLLKHFLPDPKIWLILATLIALGSPVLWDTTIDVPTIDGVFKLLWGHHSQGAVFPLFPWLAYPVVGMAFGYWLKNTNQQSKVFNQAFVAGITLVISGTMLTLTNVEFHLAEIMRSGPGAMLLSTGFVFIWLYFCQFLVKTVLANALFNLLFFWSKQVTSLYFIQWLLVGWGLMIVGSQQLGQTDTLIAMLIVLILTDLGTRIWAKLRQAPAKEPIKWTHIYKTSSIKIMATLAKQSLQTSISKPSRILAFDLARGLAILFMIIIHVLNFYGSQEVQQGFFGATIKFIFGWPSASLFIFVMGTFVAYSNNSNLSSGLKRAAMLFALGYLLNFMRATLPTWLSLEMGLVTYEQLGVHTPINGLLVVDILQCAALAYAVCILLKHFFPNPKVWLIAAMAIAFGSPVLWDISSGITAIDQVLKIFWGSKHQGSLFPLFPWLAYPLVGMAFGQWIKQSKDINKAFLRTLFAGAIIAVFGVLITLTNPEFHIADNMRSGPGLMIILIGAVLMWVWLCQFIVNRMKSYSILKLLFFWSKNVTTIYVIHFLCIGWGLMIFGAQQLNLVGTISMMIGIAIISDLATRAWIKLTLTKTTKDNLTTSKSAA